ncbi:MAG: hypothetical protein ISP32_02210 [Thermoleophilia bacterium]|nr:hypothetical protein [Thermoleophilia bacterium]
MSIVLDAHQGDGALADEALDAVAAKAWGMLVTGDLAQRDTWDQVLMWVRIGQRLADDPAPEVASRITALLASGHDPRAS